METKKKRINSKLFWNAVNWQLYYIIRIYSQIKLIKVLGDNFLSGKRRYQGFDVSFIARNTALILRVRPYACT